MSGRHTDSASMDHGRLQVALALFCGVAVAHAALTWPLRATLALFVGGGAVALVLEAVWVSLGFLDHHLSPQVLSVPVVVVPAWPAVVYVFYRLALLVAPAGVRAAALAAVGATLSNVVVDPRMVDRGVYAYPDAPLSAVRYRGVPWWNFAGWLTIVFVTALLPTAVLA